MKRILILPISVGGGHFRIAQALRNTFLKKSRFELNIQDTLDHVAWPLRFLYRNVYFFYISHWPFYLHWRRAYYRSKKETVYTKAWHWFLITCFLFLSRRLKKYILEVRPDLIICIHSLPLELISIWKKEREIKCSLVAITTDLTPHRLWVFKNVDQYYVGTDEIREYFLKQGIPSDKIKVTGIPIREEFRQDLDPKKILKKLRLSEEKKTLLILCRRLTYSVLKKVLFGLSDLNIQVIIVTEKNKKLQKNLEKIKRNFSFPVVIFDYTKNIAEVMTVADVLISKPGGIILAESFCKKLPVIAINPIPGHEEDNLKFLLDKKAILWAKNSKEIIGWLRKLLTFQKLRCQIQANIKKLAKPNATDIIVDDIIDKFLK